jgi:tetratricopeptide (TPR) repeat protein
VAALSNRGFTLRELARFDEALAALDRALQLEPDHVAALAHRGKVLSEMNRLEESFRDFRRVAELGGKPERAKPAHQIAHDREQQEWLAARGESGTARYLGGERLQGRAVDTRNEPAATQAWRASRPRIVVIDDLLTVKKLEKLLRY